MTMDHPRFCEIHVEGHLTDRGSEWFTGLTWTQTEAGDALVSGRVVDQAARHGLLARIRDLTLVAVQRLERE